MSEEFEKFGREDLSRGWRRNFVATGREFPQPGNPAVERFTSREPVVPTLP